MLKSQDKGFTLPELLLAAAILAFALAGILSLFTNCMFLNDASRDLVVAMSHAQYITEEIKNETASFTNLATRINNGIWNLTVSQIQAAPYNLTSLNNETIATAVTQAGDPLGINVTVNWNDRRQRPRNIELRTWLTDY